METKKPYNKQHRGNIVFFIVFENGDLFELSASAFLQNCSAYSNRKNWFCNLYRRLEFHIKPSQLLRGFGMGCGKLNNERNHLPFPLFGVRVGTSYRSRPDPAANVFIGSCEGNHELCTSALRHSMGHQLTDTPLLYKVRVRPSGRRPNQGRWHAKFEIRMA